jgi:hypothetical protein
MATSDAGTTTTIMDSPADFLDKTNSDILLYRHFQLLVLFSIFSTTSNF